jgi:hypothetical protein
MAKEYKLVFNCCGNEVSLGYEPKKGKHGEHCLSCDTENPDTEIKEV